MIVVVVLAALLALPSVASAASRLTATISGPGTVKRGEVATYTVVLRNTGSDTFTRTDGLNIDADAISSRRPVADPTFLFAGGAGAWECVPTACRLAPGGQFGPGDSSTFRYTAKVLRAFTLDIDVTGSGVIFSDTRKSVRTVGFIRPVISGITVPAFVQAGTAPSVGFTLSEAATVTANVERKGRIYKYARKVRKNGKVRTRRAQKCLFKKPKKPRKGSGLKIRKSKSACYKEAGPAFKAPFPAGSSSVPVARLGQLKVGGVYRLEMKARTPDLRSGTRVRSTTFKIVR